LSDTSNAMMAVHIRHTLVPRCIFQRSDPIRYGVVKQDLYISLIKIERHYSDFAVVVVLIGPLTASLWLAANGPVISQSHSSIAHPARRPAAVTIIQDAAQLQWRRRLQNPLSAYIALCS